MKATAGSAMVHELCALEVFRAPVARAADSALGGFRATLVPRSLKMVFCCDGGYIFVFRMPH